MEWKDILVLVGVVLVAGILLYRAIRKKKWCPAVFGDAADAPKDDKKPDSENP
jgi:hypothetical protein